MTAGAQELIEGLLQSIGMHRGALADDVAHVTVHHNRVLGAHMVPGFHVDAEELDDGIRAHVVVGEGARIAKPVHLCFGMLPETGLQRILLNIEVLGDSRVSVIAHCTFPNAVDVRHEMDAEIVVGPHANYSYFERHVHGEKGGVVVVPKARVRVREGGRFKTEFELIRGRVGEIDFDYETECEAQGVVEMTARISGRADDRIHIRETAKLAGPYSRGVLTTHIALRDQARANVENTLIADAPYARGHVDCKEIVRDQAIARAVPIVEVRDPKAHVTHEAAIGSVDSKQLETLMARGLSEDAACDLIIKGLLS